MCTQYPRSVLFGQWGFGADDQKGITVLLHGQPGTGKSLAAEALGYEVGKPLKVGCNSYWGEKRYPFCEQVVNCGELLSKWVGESTKNIDAIFEEARYSDAILVFDEAEGLFGSRTTMAYVIINMLMFSYGHQIYLHTGHLLIAMLMLMWVCFFTILKGSQELSF